jgi:hypothetical protein
MTCAKKEGGGQTSRLAALPIPSGLYTNLFMTPRKLVSTDSWNEREVGDTPPYAG